MTKLRTAIGGGLLLLAARIVQVADFVLPAEPSHPMFSTNGELDSAAQTYGGLNGSEGARVGEGR